MDRHTSALHANPLLESDSGSSSDESDFFDHSPTDISPKHSIQSSSHALGLSKHYVWQWDRTDAFREFYQNWKDAIVDSFQIDPRAFLPKWNETETEIRITVHRDSIVAGNTSLNTQELLGFILFKKRSGSLELTNFKAGIEMKHLNLGGTSKQSGQHKFAGIHGEGFKLAALVMRRNHHAVRISSSSFYWNFSFRGPQQDKFYCRISQPNPETLQKPKEKLVQEEAAGPRKALTSYIFQDVTVQISQARGRLGAKVTEEAFRSWAQVALDLEDPRPNNIIPTPHGDLILDQRLSGRVYLKALRVSNIGSYDTPYIFCYNFAQGRINRDRERLTSRREEARMVAKIWEHPIREGHAGAIQHYINLFRNSENHPDISLAHEVVSESVGQTLWNTLRSEMPNAFFYSEEEGHDTFNNSDQDNVIVTYLGKTPWKLPKNLWKIFRKFSLARTPLEERVRLFASSEPATSPDSHFAITIIRMLKATFRLDARLDSITAKFIKGQDFGIDILYKKAEDVLLVHDKWLYFERTHQEPACELAQLPPDKRSQMEDFACDHVVEDLIELVIDEIRSNGKLNRLEANNIRRFARQCVRQMPRRIRASAGGPDELEVSWMGNESGILATSCASDILYNVTLHKNSSCRDKYDGLIDYAGATNDSMESCGCPHEVISRKECSVVFKNLDHKEKYFPMVSRTGVTTFFGVPAPPLSPDKLSKGKPQIMGTSSHPVIRDTTISSSLSDAMFTDLNSATNPQLDINAADIRNDEARWSTWNSRTLPRMTREIFFASRKRHICAAVSETNNSEFMCRRLNYLFEIDTYVRIREDHESRQESIVLIHDVHSGNDGCTTKSVHLKVTRYSFLDPNGLVKDPSRPMERLSLEGDASGEVLLNFSNPGFMGTKFDSEVITIDNILEARPLPLGFEVIHCLKPQIGSEQNVAYCRFARSTSSGTMIQCWPPGGNRGFSYGFLKLKAD